MRKSEIEDDAYQKASGKPTEHTPEEAAKLLESIAGGEQRRSRGTVLQGRPRP